MISRKAVFGAVSLLLVSVLAIAQQEKTKEASGTVKSVAAKTLTITQDGKDMTFVVDNDTSVTAKGASHKMRKAESAGESTEITDFVMEKQSVSVKYIEKDGKMIAREVRVKS